MPDPEETLGLAVAEVVEVPEVPVPVVEDEEDEDVAFVAVDPVAIEPVAVDPVAVEPVDDVEVLDAFFAAAESTAITPEAMIVVARLNAPIAEVTPRATRLPVDRVLISVPAFDR